MSSEAEMPLMGTRRRMKRERIIARSQVDHASDQQLVRRLKERDEAALSQLYDRY
jgi:hypothetical protein